MSWFLVLLAALALIVLEKNWAPKVLTRLECTGECDKVWAEPGETVIWSATVKNHSILPIPFVRLHQRFPLEAQIHADESWIRTHCSEGIQYRYVEERMGLPPLRCQNRKVRLSFHRRGDYALGHYRLSTGDLLGFDESGRDGKGQRLVIIPGRANCKQAVQALGGFLGDISVRRFILEDPILTIGFRDYTGREPMKAVSWTRTATAGKLQVKQYDHTADQTVMVLLNVESGTPEELEACFRLTRTVCEELESKKIPFAFRTNGNLPGPVGKIFWLPSGLGSAHVNTLLYALGRANYTRFFSLQTLVNQTLQHRTHNESYIVVTPGCSGEDMDSLRRLEIAAGSRICILTGKQEVEGL